MVRVFVSHSSRDSAIAEQLGELLQASLGLTASEVRVTSVTKYALPPGSPVAENLRDEVGAADAFVCLWTPESMKSPWVLVEFGARWFSTKPLIVCIAGGARFADVGGPAKDFHAISLADASQIYSMLETVAATLHVTLQPTYTFNDRVTSLTSAARGSPQNP